MAHEELRSHKPYTESQRAEQLWLVRDLIALSTRENTLNRLDLSRLASERNVLRRSDGGSLKYSSVYRYFDAFRFLGFDGSKRYRKQGDIEWTNMAYQLADCWNGRFGDTSLSEDEKGIFREAIFRSQAAEQFLKCFCNNDELPANRQHFLETAAPLYVVNQTVVRPQGSGKSEEWPGEKSVEISHDPDSGHVIRKPQIEFLYTYRYWCLDTDIIDEININEARRFGISESRAYVLYPRGERFSIQVDEFVGIVLLTAQTRFRQTRTIPIPWLMYAICPSRRLSIADFKTLLLQAWQGNRNRLHLERSPGIFVSGLEYSANEPSYSERYGNRRYYLVVDGTLRSNLVILPKS